MSRRPHNIVIGGMGVRVKRTDEGFERRMVVNNIFVSVPRTFGEYCTSFVRCGDTVFTPKKSIKQQAARSSPLLRTGTGRRIERGVFQDNSSESETTHMINGISYQSL